MRDIICTICSTKFVSNHSQAKYCRDECAKVGKRNSWNKYSKKNRLIKRLRGREIYLNNSEQIIKRTKKYQKTKKGKAAQTKNDLRQKIINKNKIKARNILQNELKKGNILKGKCDVCGAENVNGHHDDYNKPLRVVWLCNEHHAEIHRLSRLGSLVLEIKKGFLDKKNDNCIYIEEGEIK